MTNPRPVTSNRLHSRHHLPHRACRWGLPVILALACAAAVAAPPRDRLTLLVPDGTDLNSWQAKVWLDSAAEEGVAMEVLTDSALLAMGSTASSRIAGLVVPDSAHQRASDAVVAAIKQYTFTGGKLMLVYDAAALDAAGNYPASGPSRMSDLVGVNYVLWNNGLGAGTMVGFGQVIGTAARLDKLSLPPGKYLPYAAPASLFALNYNTAFAPASRLDPGATLLMAESTALRAALSANDFKPAARLPGRAALRRMLGMDVERFGPLRYGQRVADASAARDMHLWDQVAASADAVMASVDTVSGAVVERGAKPKLPRLPRSPQVPEVPELPDAPAPADPTLQAISGYGFGPLGYYTYVTTGSFPGTVYLSSPEHGLVAGTRSYGSGQLLFVNLPLGYFKAIGTDGTPLHGFLSHFAREQVGLATLSVQPQGIGGIVYNWHVDDGDDLMSDMQYLLDNTKVLHSGPYSIHFTAGPDVITVGDGNGMNLPGNAPGRDLVRRIGKLAPWASGTGSLPVKHVLGSHGGWIHDFWGTNANEANSPDLLPLLVQNFSAIEATTGEKIREYSSPAGNTPRWATDWLEARGVVGMYLVADTGAAMLRTWRDGSRLTNKLWTSPVTPFGRLATFEEFAGNGFTDAVSGQWLLDLQSFVINKRSNRQFYNHPPGARAHLGPVTAWVNRGEIFKAARQFNWYTMTQLADFSQRRIEVDWSSTSSAGTAQFTASHPASLAEVTWLLPRRRFNSPTITGGNARVGSDGTYWVLTATGGTTLNFKAGERP